jgi:hypothetical protein
MLIRSTLTAISSAILLSACHEGTYYQDDVFVGEPLPELRSFAVIDSYGTHSDLEPERQAVLSPFIDDGYFELEWDVAPNTTHRVELLINDRPIPEGGTTLSSEWCGPFEACGTISYQYCFYQANLTMQCALPQSNLPFAERDISSLITALPQTQYFILEVCDSELSYCEFRTERVVLE